MLGQMQELLLLTQMIYQKVLLTYTSLMLGQTLESLLHLQVTYQKEAIYTLLMQEQTQELLLHLQVTYQKELIFITQLLVHVLQSVLVETYHIMLQLV